MITAAIYPNLFEKYVPFSYESIADLIPHLVQGGWISVSDMKQGYYHVALRSELVRCICFEWRGVVWAYTTICFGYASACRVFSAMTTAMYQPLRELGLPISSYIDDRANVNTAQELSLIHI